MTNYELFKKRKVINHAQCLHFAILCAESVSLLSKDLRTSTAIAIAKKALNELLTFGKVSEGTKKEAYAAYDAADAAASASAYAAASAAASAYAAASASAYAAADAADAANIHIDFETLADIAMQTNIS